MGPGEDAKGAVTQTLRDAVSNIGQPVETFKPSPANAVAGIILGLLFGALGCVLTFFFVRSAVRDAGVESWKDIGYSLLGLLIVAMGAGLIWVATRLFSLTIYVGPQGFVYAAKSGTWLCRWEEIEHVTETVEQEHAPLKGPAKLIPVGTNRYYTVRRKDGEEFTFTRDSVTKLGRLAKIIREQTEKRGVPWDTVAE